jgi:hypothetical protein
MSVCNGVCNDFINSRVEAVEEEGIIWVNLWNESNLKLIVVC